MDIDKRSPSYDPPPHQQTRSTTYSPSRGYHGGMSQRELLRDNRSPPQRFLKRSNSRSPFPRERRESDRPPSKETFPKRSREAALSPEPKLRSFNFLADDDEARETFICKHCDVKLHDLVSMESHLKGKPHLMQQQRLEDNQLRMTTGHGNKARHPPDIGQIQFVDRFWQKEKASKKLQPERKRWLDENRLDGIKPKFQGDSYDQGQFSFRQKDFYCDVCDVWVKSRDQMQQHKEGNNHKKMTVRVVRYHCDICFIDVTCKESLENHKKGADHIRRAKQQAEKKRMGERKLMHGNDLEGMRDGKSLEEYKKESYDLKRQLKILQNKVKELQEVKKFCKDTHEDKDINELMELKRNCIENHQRPIEVRKHCKQERNPRRVKLEKRHSDEDSKWGVKSERMSREERRNLNSEEGWRDVKSEWRSGYGGREGFKSERREDANSWHTPNFSELREARIRNGYIENEVETDFKVEYERGSDEEYVENETDLKSETNADEVITVD